MPTEIPGLPKVLMPLIFFVFYRINLFNLLAQNSNDNSCIFLYYMREVPNVGLKQ